jgi:DNA-binding winged helix-turn-helix (wHTH) protein/tetratricopeptide (TPR) repeat protein/TolB-like protein
MKVTTAGKGVARFGLFEVDIDRRILTKGGIRVKLQDQPFQILALLLEKPGEVVSRDEIRQKLWSADTFVEFDDGLNNAIKKLRASLSDVADNPRFVETVPRRGYRFLAPVTFSATAAETRTDPTTEAVVIAARERSRLIIEEHPRHPLSFWISVITVATLVLGTTGYLFFSHFPSVANRRGSTANGASAIRLRPSVAVLGFHNSSGRPEKVWLSTALSEMLTTELAAGEQLRTVPGEGVARMKVDLSLPESDSYAQDTLGRIRKMLGADYIVMGSFFDMGKGTDGVVRFDVRLQDAKGGEVVANIAATGTEVNIPDLAARIGAQLRDKLGVAQLSLAQAANVNASLPANEEAARLYSEGIGKLRNFDTLCARDLLEKAVAAEPNFALAHAALADAWRGLGYDSKARDEAEKAFDLSASLSREQRLWVEGHYRESTHEWDKAIEIYRSIYRFFPDNLDYGLRVAEVQTSANRSRDALDILDEMRKLPPPASDDPRIDETEAEAAMHDGDYSRDLNAATRAAEKGEILGARLLVARARHFQCWALHKLGQVQKADEACEEAQRLFAEAGDRDMVASLLVTTAAILEERGALSAAQARYQQALPIYRETGDRGGLIRALNNSGIAHRNAGNYPAAKQMYQEAMTVSREVDDKDGIQLVMGNLAGIFFYEGNLHQAHDMYEQLVVVAREEGAKDRIALQLDNLGQTLFYQGDLKGAERALDEAKALDTQSGEKRQLGYHLAALGDVLQAEGKLPEARQNRLQSLELRKALGDKADEADTEVYLADGTVEEGHPNEAEPSLRDAVSTLHSLKALDDEVYAYSVLARALLAAGKSAGALKVLETASPLEEQSRNRVVHVVFDLAAGRVRAANGQLGRALQALTATKSEATAHGFIGYTLEARLALGEIEKANGRGAALADLAALEKDARAKGFLLIAGKARADLQKY